MRSASPSARTAAGLPPKLPAWVGDVVAAIVVIGTAFIPFPEAQFHPTDPAGYALVVAPALVLPWRRRFPVAALAACVVLYGVAAFAADVWPGIVLAVAIAVFAVATRSSRRRTVVVTLVTIGVVVLISVTSSLVVMLGTRIFAIAITIAFAAAAADAERSARAYISAITERAERAEQTRESEARRRVSEERLRIARDLHDVVAHQIAVISLNAGVAASALPARPEAAEDAVRTIRSAAHTVLGEIGTLLEVLRTDEAAPGSPDAPQPGIDSIADLVEAFADAGLAVTLRTAGDLATVGATSGLTAYRVVQEALTNAHKHGVGGRAHVLVSVDGALHVVVTNPTRADAGVAEAPPGSGLGLIGVRERVSALRGSVEAGSVPGGWRVSATLPLSTEGAR